MAGSITGTDLRRLFTSLPSSKGKATFVAAPVPAHGTIRIGRSAKETPVLLIKLQGSSTKFTPGARLSNLSTDYSVPCTIQIKSGALEEGAFAIVEFTGDNTALYDYFFAVTASLVSTLPRHPTALSVKATVNKFIDLFSLLISTPRGTVQGLWTELFLISLCSNPAPLLRCWHRELTERFDFSAEADRLEVKSYAGSKREHHFSLEQLRPGPDLNILVLSINIRHSAGGISIADLRERIIRKVAGDSDAIYHLEHQISETLGAGLPQALAQTFDYQIARDSIRWFEATAIPSVAEPPSTISRVSFVSDLTLIEPCGQRVLQSNSLYKLFASRR